MLKLAGLSIILSLLYSCASGPQRNLASTARPLSCELGNYRQIIHSERASLALVRQTRRGCQLEGADLRDQNFTDAHFIKANLKEAIFRGDLENSDFKRADLRNAQLRDSTIGGANFQLADLRGTSLENVRGIASASFKEALYDEWKTRFPPNFDPKKAGALPCQALCRLMSWLFD